MSRVELKKWEQKYKGGEYTPNDSPSALLVEWLTHIPEGKALDVACGLGRNALFLAQRGFIVDAIDISAAGLAIARRKALERGLAVNWIQADLDSYNLPSQSYDLIIDNFYLNRDLAPKMIASLKPKGTLLFEHHLMFEGNAANGTGISIPSGHRTSTRAMRHAPSSPELWLKTGELLALFGRMEVLHYSENPVMKEGKQIMLAQLVARKKNNSEGGAPNDTGAVPKI